MTPEERDILIELKTTTRYIKEGVDHLKNSDKAQWNKIDEHGTDIAVNKTDIKGIRELNTEAIGTLKKAIWMILGTLLSGGGVVGVIAWAMNH